jgi:hypothetical protein
MASLPISGEVLLKYDILHNPKLHLDFIDNPGKMLLNDTLSTSNRYIGDEPIKLTDAEDVRKEQYGQH